MLGGPGETVAAKSDQSSPCNATGQGSALCTHCGLCCMGAIHGSVVLDADEISAAQAQGLPVIETERPSFTLPCPRLEGTMCSIYSRRPKACARYRCQLLKDFQAAAVDLPRALEHVATAKRLLARLRRSMPTGMTITEARASIHAQSGSGASELAAMELKLHVFALELYLDRHFRNSRDRRSLVLEAAESESEEN